MVYYALVVLILAFALFMHGEQKGNSKYILVAIILMFCVYGLRDAFTIGADSTSSYLIQFENMENKTWDDMPSFSDWAHSNDEEQKEKNGHERNFALPWVMKIVYDLTDGDYQYFIILISVFVMIAVAHFINRYSVSPVQSILYYLGLLFFTFNISALKQSVAMAFVLFSFDAIQDRKLLHFILLVTVASFFHFPAMVFLPAYWIADMRLEKSYLIMLAVMFVLTYYFRDQLVDWLTDTYDTAINDNSGMRFLGNKVIVMLFIIAAALVIRPPSAEDTLFNSLLMILGVAAVIQTFAGYNNTFERLADYYFQFAIIFIPMVFENVNTRRAYLSPQLLSVVRGYGPYVFCTFAIWRFLHVVMNDGVLTPFRFCFQA